MKSFECEHCGHRYSDRYGCEVEHGEGVSYEVSWRCYPCQELINIHSKATIE